MKEERSVEKLREVLEHINGVTLIAKVPDDKYNREEGRYSGFVMAMLREMPDRMITRG